MKLEPISVVPALAESLKHPRVIVRIRASEALGKFGPAASAALPALELAAHDDYQSVRFAAQEALAAIRLPIECETRPTSHRRGLFGRPLFGR
jgi:HEAT repeat protein